jgi:hypothetical protein
MCMYVCMMMWVEVERKVVYLLVGQVTEMWFCIHACVLSMYVHVL